MQGATSTPEINHIKILQINLNHCKNAQELLTQSAMQYAIDVVLISEPWSPPSYWHNDGHKSASIWLPQPGNKLNRVKCLYKSKGIVAVQIQDHTFISCYISPNISLESYTERISELERFLDTINIDKCIIAGDFNAKSTVWGSRILDDHGTVVMEMCNNFGLIPKVSTGSHTFERNGHYSTIDILLCGSTAYNGITSSQILEDYTASDHRYLKHVLSTNTANTANFERKKKFKLDADRFSKTYLQITKIADPLKITSIEDIDAYIDMITEVFESTSYTLHQTIRRRKEVWWWNAEIAALRKASISSRRSLQRARIKLKKHPEISNEEVVRSLNKHNKNKKALKHEIARAKRKSWTTLIDEIDTDIWGRPYKAVMGRVAGKPPPSIPSEEETEEVIKTLFQTSPEPNQTNPNSDGTDTAYDASDRPFAEAEVLKAMKSVKKKAPGIDDIPSELVQLLSKIALPHVTQVINTCTTWDISQHPGRKDVWFLYRRNPGQMDVRE
ncbi:uncharacterized protein LOC143219944 [Lasioglossum baleicum]|uniref:uncharacterized protein LOC143219944 n=1 Tax=Lasioglossum baleicum TaxID=434251 RepID=UPI003FCDE25F